MLVALGWWLLLNGLGLTLWCASLLATHAELPRRSDPTTLVIAGPYAVVRNPMMLGLLLIMLGFATLRHSGLGAVLVIFAALAGHWFVCRIEEPALAQRFGPHYDTYRCAVPRWVPRRGCGG